MSVQDTKLKDQTPAPAPLSMPLQDFARPFEDPAAPALKQVKWTGLYRLATFVPAAATTLALVLIIMDWFRKDGFVPIEIAMMALVGFSAFWIALSVASSTIGLFFGRNQLEAPAASKSDALDVALTDEFDVIEEGIDYTASDTQIVVQPGVVGRDLWMMNGERNVHSIRRTSGNLVGTSKFRSETDMSIGPSNVRRLPIWRKQGLWRTALATDVL